MFYDNVNKYQYVEHEEFSKKFDQLDKRVDVIQADLKAIRYLLIGVIASILGTGVNIL